MFVPRISWKSRGILAHISDWGLSTVLLSLVLAVGRLLSNWSKWYVCSTTEMQIGTATNREDLAAHYVDKRISWSSCNEAGCVSVDFRPLNTLPGPVVSIVLGTRPKLSDKCSRTTIQIT
jgi:hypothetical protein